MNASVRDLVLARAKSESARQALWIAGSFYTYQELSDFSIAMKKTLGDLDGATIAIVSGRPAGSYFSIFGSIVNGACYVPINSQWPAERIQRILALARPDFLLLDEEAGRSDLGKDLADQQACPTCIVAVTPQQKTLTPTPAGSKQVSTSPGPDGRGRGKNDLLYVMFTSGSTGVPKGVPIGAANVSHYVVEMTKQYRFDENDRFIQSVELTFDLSVHDTLLCWANGGMLVVVPTGNAPMAPRFIRQLGVTRCLSVPSAAAQAKSLGLLKAGSMPTLKTSFFCGEALPTSLAESWAAAAPASEIHNIYGPTEATIAFSTFNWKENRSNPYSVVPLGFPIGAQEMRVDESGELLLSGAQVFAGYIKDESRKPGRPVLVELDGRTWYRTGDLASFDEDFGFIFKGRLDSQVKVRGYRVEIGEVESALRTCAGTELIAVLPTKQVGPSTYDDLVGIVCRADRAPEEIIEGMKKILPAYMVPERIVELHDMPKNSNDKIDYVTLARTYAQAGEAA
ncbi:MAG: AMP-binding protein [Xanthobacteraceae bacterium]|nr:AMP-binding protein [Xanthobacteraceae bacterium]